MSTGASRQRQLNPSRLELMSNPESATVSNDTVAEWMLQEVEREGLVYQETVAYDIERKFGDAFIYINEHGNPAISKGVLEAFRRISEDTVVWERQNRAWRKREPVDQPGRQHP